MAYQKLQPIRAISWVPTDDVIIPNPGAKVSSGTSDASTLTDHLLFTKAAGTNGFIGVVTLGATVYNSITGAYAKVVAISESALRLNADIFQAPSQNFVVYNTDSNNGCLIYVGGGGSGTKLDIVTAGGDEVSIENQKEGEALQILVSEVQGTSTASNLVALW
jgi:hypothetical protein